MVRRRGSVRSSCQFSKLFAKCGTWQYGTGTVPGISGSVDLDAVYKDYEGMIRDIGLNHLSNEPLTIFKDDIISILEHIREVFGI